MKNMNKKHNSRIYGSTLFVTLVALALLMAGCQPQPTPTESPEAPPPTEPPTAAPAATEAPEELPAPAEVPPELMGSEWVLIAYGDAANPLVVEPNTRPTAVFGADGNVSGSGGCNSFTSAFQVDGEKISFGPAASTMMACEIGMDQETAYLAALGNAQSYQLVGEDRLLIDYDSGAGYPEQLVYDAQTPLFGPLWVLTEYGDPQNPTPSQAGVTTTAVFSADGIVNGSAGCNSYNASYTMQDGQIKVGLPTSTMMACETGMEQEQAYLTALEMAESYRLAGPYLEITYAEGAAVMRFSSVHLPLENVRWVLSLIDGQPLPAEVQANLIFTPGKDGEDNQVNGNAGCNGFFGTYTVDGNILSMPGPFGATQMMCDEAVMQVEQNFLTGLEGAQSYDTVLQQLTITTASGSMVFYADRFPLQGPIWKLVSLGDVDNQRPPIEGADFTATFVRDLAMPSGHMSGTSGCNDYISAYYANLHEIKVNLPQTSQNTCSDAQTEEEQAYFLGLNSARDYRILGNELEIYYDGMMLKFVGVFPPPEGTVGPLLPLDGTKWWLTSVGTFKVIPGSETTAQFKINPDGTTGQISGSTGCNTYNTEITGVFTVGLASVTQLLCNTPAGIMEQERAYLAALGSASNFSLEGKALRISTSQGDLNFTSTGPSPEQPLPTPGPTDTPSAVLPLPITAVISAPTEGQVDEAIVFDGSGSISGAEITSYVWDFGDEVVGEGVTIEHAFAQPGVYTVTLTITDSAGQTASATVEVTIS